MTGPRRFALPAALVRGALVRLRDELAAAVAMHQGLVLDVGNVLEVDGPGVQLLLAAARECRERGVRLELAGASEALRTALAGSHAEQALA